MNTTALLAVRPDTAAYTFPDSGQTVRTVNLDGEPWFVAADVCLVLGHAHTASALRILDDDERRTIDFGRPAGVLSQHTPAMRGKLTVISESGLYSLIIRSQVAGAAAFRRWVTHDVLPAIRKTGTYTTPAAAPAAVLDSPESVLALASAFHAAALRLVDAEQRVAELEPAAEAWEALADATGDYSLREAALILNRDPAISTGQNRLMTFLRAEGMVDRRGVPYQRHAAHLTERPVTWTHPSGETRLTYQIRITVDGLAYLHRRLGGIKRGVLAA